MAEYINDLNSEYVTNEFALAFERSLIISEFGGLRLLDIADGSNLVSTTGKIPRNSRFYDYSAFFEYQQSEFLKIAGEPKHNFGLPIVPFKITTLDVHQ